MFASGLATTAPVEGAGWIGTWSPGIGDPTFVGWFTVVAYFVAAWACWRRARALGAPTVAGPAASAPGASSFGTFLLAFAGARRRLLALPATERLRTLWLGLAIVLAALGVNKQLDLQTIVTEVGRLVARRYGWYAVRGHVQLAFIAFVALVGLALYRAVLLLARGELRSLRAVLAGTLFIVCFVTIRAASFHHIDRFLGTDIGGFRANWLVELGGIAFIIVGALRAGRPRDAAA